MDITLNFHLKCSLTKHVYGRSILSKYNLQFTNCYRSVARAANGGIERPAGPLAGFVFRKPSKAVFRQATEIEERILPDPFQSGG